MIRINLLQGMAVEVEKAPSEPASPNALQVRVFVGTLLASTLALAGAHWFLSERLTRLNEQMEVERRNAAALAAIQAVNARYTAELQVINRRIAALQVLQDKRQSPGQLMTQLANDVNRAPGLYLISVAPQGARLSLSGASNSVNSIATFVRDLQLTEGFGDVQLREYYEDDEKDGGVSFRFSLDLSYAAPQGVSSQNAPPKAGKPAAPAQPTSHGS